MLILHSDFKTQNSRHIIQTNFKIHKILCNNFCKDNVLTNDVNVSDGKAGESRDCKLASLKSFNSWVSLSETRRELSSGLLFACVNLAAVSDHSVAKRHRGGNTSRPRNAPTLNITRSPFDSNMNSNLNKIVIININYCECGFSKTEK